MQKLGGRYMDAYWTILYVWIFYHKNLEKKINQTVQRVRFHFLLILSMHKEKESF